MADKKISELTEVTTLSDTSLITAVDLARAAGDENVKIQKSNLQTDLTPTLQEVVDVGNSVTSDIQFSDQTQIISNYPEGYGSIEFNEGVQIKAVLEPFAGGEESTVIFNHSDITLVYSDLLTAKGIVGQNYYGANYDDNTYVQKIYVDDATTEIATYSATSTTVTTLDCDAFDSIYQILTTNTDIQWSNTPASGESFVKTLEVIGAFSLTFTTSTKVIGTYVDDGTTVNIITVNFANYPTVGLRTTVMINQ